MTKRIQIVARIDPTLRKAVGRAVKQKKTTLNALIEAALTQYLGVPERSLERPATPAKDTK